MNIHSVNALYSIVDKVDGFTEEKEGNKYLNFAFSDNNSEVLKKYAKPWNGIKNLIEKIKSGKSGEYEKDYMKIKFKISCYYWFNRRELLQKAKDKYHNCGGKEKAAEYYTANKDVIKQ